MHRTLTNDEASTTRDRLAINVKLRRMCHVL